MKLEIEKTSKNLNKLKKILKPETKLEVKLEKLKKDFDELRHKFCNKDEISEYRKAFYNAKNKNINKLNVSR